MEILNASDAKREFGEVLIKAGRLSAGKDVMARMKKRVADAGL